VKNIFKGLGILTVAFGLLFVVYPHFANHVVYGAGEAGTVDSTFFNGTYPGTNHGVNYAVEQSNGKIILVGAFTTYMGKSKGGIVRINGDGSIDTSLDVGTGIVGTGIQTVALQSDGKILIGGNITAYDGTTVSGIARLNSNGSLDSTFNNGGVGITGTFVNTIALQTDGKILIGGIFTAYNGTARKNIARLNIDGSLDTSFNPGTGPSSTVNSIVIQSSGLIVIAGPFSTYNGTSAKMIARLNTDGTLDGTFASGTGFTGTAMWRLALQSDDKIMAGGFFSAYKGTTRNKIARLNADGSLDTSFDPSTGPSGAVNDVSIQTGGKILIGGYFDGYNGTTRHKVALLNSDGTLDTTFDPGASSVISSVSTVKTLSSGNIIIGGIFKTLVTSYRANVAMLNPDGSVISSFNDVDAGFNEMINTLALQPNGKIIVAGDFTSMNGVARDCIARLNTDGTLDATFVSNVDFYGSLVTLALQSDGKIIVGGSDYGSPFFVRLNTNGTLDETLNIGTGFNNDVNYVVVQPDQKILVGGAFTSYNGTAVPYMVRLNSDGSLDDTFNVGTGPDDGVTAFALQSDGKILLSGWFTAYNGNNVNSLARLNSDGSFDSTFVIGTGLDSAADVIKVLPSGKILLGGAFWGYNGNNIRYLLRLNSDGSFDSTFNTGTGPDNEVWTLAIQSDGKIIIAGFFYKYDGHDAVGVARLSADGAFDSTFSVGLAKRADVEGLAIQSDGKIILGGEFTSANDSPVAFVTRVLGSEVAGDLVAPTGSISISSGSSTTSTPIVSLNLSATDETSTVSQMRISENQDFSGSDWETYATTKTITLSAGNGTKTIYIEFKDSAGNISTIYSDSIILAAPVVDNSNTEQNGEGTPITSSTESAVETETTSPLSTRTVTIEVLDQKETPIENAYVEIVSEAHGYTDILGSITFNGISEGTKQIKITYQGHQTESTIEILGSDSGDVSLPVHTTITLDSVNITDENPSETGKGLSTINIVLISLGGLLILVMIIILAYKNAKSRSSY